MLLGYRLIERVTREDPVIYENREVPVRCEKNSDLEAKVGFKYLVDLTERETLPNVINPDPLLQAVRKFRDAFSPVAGSKYKFEIHNGAFGRAREYLHISNYSEEDPSMFPTTFVHIKACDGVRRVRLRDRLNNTNLILQLWSNGNIAAEGMPIEPETAKTLFDHYVTLFDAFKEKYDIDAAIRRYRPKIDIKITPP